MYLSSKEEYERYHERFLSGECDKSYLEVLGLSPVILVNERDDCGLFLKKGEKVYEAHYLFKSRGKDAFLSSNEFLERMFEIAEVITGEIKAENRPAKLLTRKLGFTSLGVLEYPQGDYELFMLSKKDFKWVNC